MSDETKKDNPKPYSSPPCSLHELSADYLGFDTSDDQRHDPDAKRKKRDWPLKTDETTVRTPNSE